MEWVNLARHKRAVALLTNWIDGDRYIDQAISSTRRSGA
jgi:hypothetical protein